MLNGFALLVSGIANRRLGRTIALACTTHEEQEEEEENVPCRIMVTLNVWLIQGVC